MDLSLLTAFGFIENNNRTNCLKRDLYILQLLLEKPWMKDFPGLTHAPIHKLIRHMHTHVYKVLTQYMFMVPSKAIEKNVNIHFTFDKAEIF